MEPKTLTVFFPLTAVVLARDSGCVTASHSENLSSRGRARGRGREGERGRGITKKTEMNLYSSVASIHENFMMYVIVSRDQSPWLSIRHERLLLSLAYSLLLLLPGPRVWPVDNAEQQRNRTSFESKRAIKQTPTDPFSCGIIAGCVCTYRLP